MTDLRTVLHKNADDIAPHGDVDDVFRRVARNRRRARAVGVGACISLVAMAAVGAVVLRRDPMIHTQVAPVATPIGAIQIDGAAVGSALERHDPSAIDGPWTIVVRRIDGSLGLHSAVVTFPVEEPTALAGTVAVGDIRGFAGARLVVWPIAGSWARVRGDLDRADLVRIAEATSVSNRYPAVGALDGFSVGAVQTSRATSIDELRYGSTDVGQGAALGNGLTYTGLLAAGGFEDQLFEVNGRTGYTVQGRPAVVSSVNGGNGTLAWEISPGVVAYVGYSGLSMNDTAIAGLVELADHTSPLTPEEWRGLGPQLSEQVND